MDKKRVLIFDYDGTIVDSELLVFNAFNSVAEKYGLKKLKSLNELGNLYRKNVFQSILELGLKGRDLTGFFKDWRESYLKNYKRIKAFNGIKKVISTLAEGNKIIIISSNSTMAVRMSMDYLGIRVHEVIGADKEISKVVKIKKIVDRYPDFDYYYMGDTVGDVVESKKAGVNSVAVTWGFNSRKMLLDAEPDFIVNEPKGLFRLFND